MLLRAGVVNEPPVPSELPPVGAAYQFNVPEPVAESVVVSPAHTVRLPAAVVLLGAAAELTVNAIGVRAEAQLPFEASA